LASISKAPTMILGAYNADANKADKVMYYYYSLRLALQTKS